MGARASKPDPAELARLQRRCAARRTAHTQCQLANPGNAAACERLEAALVMCYVSGARRRPSAPRRAPARRPVRGGTHPRHPPLPLDPRCTLPRPPPRLRPPADLPGAKDSVAAHERCLQSLMNVGFYAAPDGKRRANCHAELDALKAALTQRGLFPFPPP